MSPNTLASNDVLTTDNYFLWEFPTRMSLVRKGVADHVLVKPEPHMQQSSNWKADDLKALALIVKRLSPMFQTMIREAQTAYDAWEILRAFFAKQNLHNRVQLRKQRSDFELEEGGNLMDHLMQFDELCLKLAAAGEIIRDDEKLVVLLGSLPREYDAMVRIIEATLLSAKEMLRREYETLQKREKKEMAFKVASQYGGGGSRRNPRGHKFMKKQAKGNGGSNGQFRGKCFFV
jgi:hypothetical protein